MNINKYHISVVDDSKAVRVAFGTLLEMAGYDVSQFKSGVDFFDDYPNSYTNCIVLDLEMPKMGGIAVLNKLEELASGPPVIVVTGTRNQAVLDSANRDMVRCILTKPVKPSELVEAISEAVQVA
jgi:two-component system response regulator FixJ